MARIFQFNGAGSRIEVSDETLQMVAEDLAAARGQMITRTLLMAGVIRLIPDGPAKPNDRITCRAAVVQDSKATGGYQAAHLLPGQIFVNDRCIWTPTDRSRIQRRGRLANSDLESRIARIHLRIGQCCMATTSLPAYFNRADSIAEANGVGGTPGLKMLFAQSVEILWRESRPNPTGDLAYDSRALKQALEHWFENANEIYAQAATRKLDKALATNGGAKEEDRINEGLVLEAYANGYKVNNVNGLLRNELLNQQYIPIR